MDQKLENLLHPNETSLKRGNAADAVNCLETALAQSPDSPRILERLAVAYRENGQYIPALKTYDHIIELNAATATTWLAPGNALSDCGEYAQAIGAYEKSLELDEANAETHHNLAKPGKVAARLAGGRSWQAYPLPAAIREKTCRIHWNHLAVRIGPATAAVAQRAAANWLCLRILSQRERHEAGLGADQQSRPIQIPDFTVLRQSARWCFSVRCAP